MKFRAALFWMTLLLLLVFTLSMLRINAFPYIGDERWTIEDAGGPGFGPKLPWDIWTWVGDTTIVHPPLYYILLNQWATFVGWTPLAARMLTLLLGLLAVAWTYRLGRDFLPGNSGLYGAAILGTSIFFTQYLIIIRMYSLLVLASVIAVWAYLKLVNSHRWRWRIWWTLALATAVGIYSHYFMGMVMVGVAVYHLLFVRKDRRWWQIAAAALPPALLFLPWSVVAVRGVEKVTGRTGGMGVDMAFSRLGYLFGNTLEWLPIVGLLLALSAVPLKQRGVRPIMFIVGVALTLMIAFGESIEFLTAGRIRYTFGLWPLITLIFGVALVQMPRIYGAALGRWLALAGLAAWMIPGVYHSYIGTISLEFASAGYIFPLHTLNGWLTGRYQTNDLLLNYVPDAGTARSDYDDFAEYSMPTIDNYFMLKTDEDERDEWDERIDEALSEARRHERVWLAWSPERAPAALDLFLTPFEQEYQYCATVDAIPEVRVDLYSRLPLCCAAYTTPPESALARFGDIVSLTGFEVLAADTRRISAAWAWSPGAALPGYTYSAALLVFDANDALVAQTDVGLELPATTCQQVEITLPDAPPGEYQLRVTVYAWQTLERLTGTLSETGQSGDQLPLATVQIAP